jgi:hypothetical protein
MLVARDNECAEAKAATAFDDLGGTVDENNLFAQFGTAARTALFAAFSGGTTRSGTTGTLTTRSTTSSTTAATRSTKATRAAACICV